MAYNPRALHHVHGVGGESGQKWVYEWTDSIATVNTPGYFSDAASRGMTVGDEVTVKHFTDSTLSALAETPAYMYVASVGTSADVDLATAGGGSSSVTGPGSSGNNNLVAWDGVGGTTLKDSGIPYTTVLVDGDIGTTVQAKSAQLDEWAATDPSANGLALITAANYGAMRALLDLEVGTDFLSPAQVAAAYQAISSSLTALSGTAPANTIAARVQATAGVPSYVGLADLTSVTPASLDFLMGFTAAGALRRFPVSGFSTGGGGTAVNIDYTTTAVAGQNSLLSQTLVLGATYRTIHWDNLRTRNSGGIWYCYTTTPTGTPGVVTHVGGIGLVLGHTSGGLVLVTEAPGANPAQIGARWDSVTTGQQGLIHTVRDYCIANFVPLYMEGRFMLVDATIDLSTIHTIRGEAALFREPAAGFSGTMLVTSGINTSTYHQRKLRADGINVGPDAALGQFDFQGTQSLATGFEIRNDRGGFTSNEIWCSRLRRGALLGEIEKGEVIVHAVYCHLAVESYLAPGLTSDTVIYKIFGTLNKMIFKSGGGDTSEILELNTESAICDGSTVASYRFPSHNRYNAYAELGNGKYMEIRGRQRAFNGPVMLTDDRNAPPGSDGASAIHFGNFNTVHTYGIVYDSYGVQQLTGRLDIEDNGDGRINSAATVSTLPCPTVWLREVGNGSGFHLCATRIYSREAVRWGDNSLDLQPMNADMGRYSGSVVTPGADDYKPLTGTYPVGQTYLHIEAATNCTAVCAFEGEVIVESGSVNNYLVFENGADWIRHGYSILDENGDPIPAGRLTVLFQGRMTQDDIFFKTWLFDGISCEYIEEYNGPATYRNGAWYVGQPIVTNASQLLSATHPINAKTKKAGQLVWDATTAKTLYCVNGTANTAWKAVADDVDVYPSASIGFQTITNSFEGWVTGVGGTLSPSLKDIVDQHYFDLAAGGVDVTTDLIGHHPLMWGSDRTVAKVNMSRNLYHLTEVAPTTALTWTAAGNPLPGFKGNGVDNNLDTGFNAQVTAHGMTANSQHIGIWLMENSPSGDPNAGDFDAGTDNRRLRVQAQGGTGNVVTTGGNASTGGSPNTGHGMVFPTTSSTPPHHVGGSRNGSTTATGYSNGLPVITNSFASVATLPDAMRFIRQNTNYSNRTMAAGHYGLKLTDSQWLTIYTATRKTGQLLGAI